MYLFQVYCAMDMKCLPLSAKCDGKHDCSDGYDEANCGLKYKGNRAHGGKNITRCEIHEFECEDELKCIRKIFVCDGQRDCEDGSDEVDCCKDGECKNIFKSTSTTTTTTPSPVISICEAPHRWCDNNTQCLDKEFLCDGFKHCQDGTDEGPGCGETYLPILLT